jgi:hypothetical protein
MIRQSSTREQILYAMAEANWPYADANELVRRMASRERWIGVATILACGAVGVLGLLVTWAMVASRSEFNGGVVAFIIFGIVGAVYGLVRLLRVRV